MDLNDGRAVTSQNFIREPAFADKSGRMGGTGGVAFLRRLQNLTSYLSVARLTAALGLLTSEARQRWVLTIGSPRLSNISLEETFPWFAFQSIEYLESLIKRDMTVIEYGSGYSTIWWSSRVSEVITVERTKAWSLEVTAALAKHKLKNVTLVTFEKFPDVSEEQLKLQKTSMKSLIDEYIACPLMTKRQCDIVVVDDVLRNDVLKAAADFLKPGGLMILDDSERARHKPVMEWLRQSGWSSASFFGSAPYHFHEKQTSIWFKPTISVASNKPMP